MKKTFTIDQKAYETQISGFENYISVESVYQFPLILPYYVPVEDGSILRLGLEEEDIFFIAKFDSIEFQLKCNDDLSEMTLQPQDRILMKTIIEVLVLSENQFKESPDVKQLNISIDKVLIWLNHILINLKIKTGLLEIERITRKHLPTGMICHHFSPDKWDNRITIGTITNTNNREKNEQINKRQWEWIVKDALNKEHSLFPFESPENLSFKALRNFKEGKFQDAVIFIQTSVESLFKIYYLYYAIVNNIEEKKRNNIIKNYKGLIQDTAKKYLRGNWTIKEENAILYNYWTKTYELRNKIIHSDYLPVFEEARLAIECGLTLTNEINKSLKDIGRIKSIIQSYYNGTESYASRLFKFDGSFSDIKRAADFMVDQLKNSGVKTQEITSDDHIIG